jgi:tetratricopeptide (TPR) repeat protein
LNINLLRLPSILYFVFFLNPVVLWSQGLDTAAIHRMWLHAHQIHADSPALAQTLCYEILQQSTQANYLKGQGDAYLTLGLISRNAQDYPKSYDWLHQSLAVRRALGDTNRVAAVFINIGINLLEESKYDSALAVVLYAINIVEALPEPEYDVLGSEYLLLSNILDEYQEPEDALKYAQKSFEAYQKTSNQELIGKASYALANRFLGLTRRDSALYYYDKAIDNFRASSNDLSYLSEIKTNKAIIYMQLGNLAQAEVYFNEAQRLLEQMGDQADWFHLCLNKGAFLVVKNEWEPA